VPCRREAEWPEATIQRVTQLHAEGLTIAEIGRRMGLSKNKVGGKISRLGLNAGRPPLIVSKHDGRAAKPKRVIPLRNPKHTLPPLASELAPA
jgi:hypothetical protein